MSAGRSGGPEADRVLDAVAGWWTSQGPLRATAGLLRHLPAAPAFYELLGLLAIELERVDAKLRLRHGERWWDELSSDDGRSEPVDFDV
jgi:hypothetical protein